MVVVLIFISLFVSCHSNDQGKGLLVKSDVIYGEDNRSLLKNSPYEELGKSIATMVYPGRIRKAPRDPGFYKVGQTPAHIAYDICKEEKFSEQNVLGACTGFLIDENILMTAGHCISEKIECENVTWVFNRLSGDELIHEDYVYGCEEILHTGINVVNNYMDFTILKLNRKVKKVKPLKMNFDVITAEEPVFTIGHPFGVPLVIAEDAFVTSTQSTYSSMPIPFELIEEDVFEYNIEPSNYFMANLDVFTGNSGSPVFNNNEEVIGMISSGKEDWNHQNEFCKTGRILDENKKDTELIIKINKINSIKDIL